MSFPFFISKRFIFKNPTKQDRFISFISAISIIGIALGVAALIIAISILNGFEKTITEKITDFDSHIQITSYQTILPDYHRILPELYEMLQPDVESVSPYASKIAVISSKKGKEGVSLKGIMPDVRSINVKENIVEGKFVLGSGSIVIGRKLANKLYVSIGDKVTIFALSRDEIPSPEHLPNIKRFIITGIFESGMAEYDDLNAYVSLDEAQELFEIGDNITGYDIKLKNISKINSCKDYLSDKLRYPHAVRSVYQIHRNIFTWIELQKKPIPIVLGLITIVAVFNIIGTLLMIVLEKTNAIGTMKSLGARKRQIVAIFLYQGGFLAAAGIILGNLLAFILTWLQLEYSIISLPSSVYFVSKVPVSLSWEIFLEVSALTLVLCFLASFIPSYIGSKVQPISTLRFQ
ncbi:MAG: ABC transporter permease [Ignavibacteria bacterium]